MTLAVYLSTLRNGFVLWDDTWYIVDNVNIHSLNPKFLRWAFFESRTFMWHPLTWISHAVDYAVWGANPAGHHLTSILLHAFNTLLVYTLVVRLIEAGDPAGVRSRGSKSAVAAMTAFLFGLHPVHVESAAWAAERRDVLSTFFFLLALVSYLRYRRAAAGAGLTGRAGPPLGPYLWCLGCAALALMSKPMTVTLPLVMLIVDWHPLGRFGSGEKKTGVLLEKLPFFLLSLLTVLIQFKTGFRSQFSRLFDSQILTTILATCRSLTFYLVKMLWPRNLSPYYYYSHDASFSSPRNLISLALVVAITAACVFLIKRMRSAPASWAYFVVTLLPVLAMYRTLHTMADRYTYLPSIGPFLMAGSAAAWAWEKAGALKWGRPAPRHIMAALAVLMFLGLPALTLKQISVWKDSETLWSHVIGLGGQPAPEEAVARNNLGLVLDARGEYARAMREYELALRIDPFSHQTLNNLGVTLGRMGRFKESIAYFSKAIRLKPDYVEAHANLGVALEATGRTREAIDSYREALRLDPRDRNARHNLDEALAGSQR